MTGLDLLDEKQRNLYIDGTWREANSGDRFEVHDPADGSVITEIADADATDAMDALDAAVAAQRDWARTAPRERGEILRKAFGLLQERAGDFAHLMSLEMGKTVAEARGEVTYGSEFFRWFSEEAVRVHGRWMHNPAGGSRLLTLRKPVGPCLFITPWNFPLAMATRKIAPAIAAGCTMVVKPATLTPLTTLLMTQVLEEAGLPKGVLNVVPTTKASDVTGPLLQDPRLRKLSFTGSTEVGRGLLRGAADQVLRTSMELGGNAPFLVFEDADLDKAVEGAMLAKLRNMGEACTAANRFIVHADVADEFAEKLTAKMKELPVKRGTEDDAKIGPLIDEKSRTKVHELVEDAVAKGATVTTGGEPQDGPGYFYPPTVLTGVTGEARILAEEVFGPVAPIVTFTDEDDAIAMANDTEFGLVAYAYTNDLSRSVRLTERIESGMLGVNVGVVSNPAAPFGGVKQSGLGREGGFEGIEEFLETKYVGLADPFADVQKG